MQNYDRLSDSAKSRLTVENDDKPALYSTKMLYDNIVKRTGTPIVFDSHHFACGPQDSDYEEALQDMISNLSSRIRSLENLVMQLQKQLTRMQAKESGFDPSDPGL